MKGLLVLYYFRWVGTPAELQEWMGRVICIAKEIEGVDIKGLFTPATSERNFVTLIETTSFDKALEVYKTYVKKYGINPKLPLQKAELLYTLQELGMG